MVYLQATYELCFGEAYFEYSESCDFPRENTNKMLHAISCLEYPHSFICKSHGKQEVDVR